MDEAEAGHLGGDRGYFIYEVDESKAEGIIVLAKAASLEAAYRLAAGAMLGVAIITGMNVIANAEGEKIEVDKGVRRIRFTQVWFWRKDRWLREAFQATQTTDQPNPE